MSSSNNSGLYSVFIPIISKIHTEEKIANYFALNYVGKVERVDFVEDTNDVNKVRKAFVHFSPDQKTHEIMEAIDQKGSYRFYPCKILINLCSFKQQNEVVFSARMQHKINDLISINSRAFAFNNSNSLDYELRNSISYKLNSSFSLEARHNFEKRAYFENNRKYNYVNRSLNFGFIYNF